MSLRLAFLSCVALLASATAGFGQTTISGSYTAVNTANPAGAPTINDTSNTAYYLASPLTKALTVGQTTSPQNFLLVAPTSGSGTVTGSILVDMSLTDGTSVTAVSNTPGANTATLVNGGVVFDANYAIDYATQTDCITWAGTCKPAASAGPETTALSDTLLLTFADGAKLDMNLYSWQDWNMEPQISFDLVSGPEVVPEPASVALFASAVAALAFIKRRRAGV
jgi:hypothetical protein